MHCDDCQSRLTALADGELGWAAAWQVRRHCKHCSACAELFAQIVQVGAVARTYAHATDASTPDTLLAQIRRHLAAPPLSVPEGAEVVTGPVFVEKEIAMSLSPAVLPHRVVPWYAAPRLRSVTAATVVLVAAVGFGTHVLLPGKPPVAFADVRRAVQQVSTAHIRYRVTPMKAEEEVQMFEAWLRVRPAKFVLLMGEGVSMVGDENGTRVYPGEGNGDPIHVADAKFTSADIADILLSPDALLGGKPGRPQVAARPWGGPEAYTTPDGTRLLRFRTQHDNTQIVLLVDAETQRPVHVEIRTLTGAAESDGPTTEVDFGYNETPPPGTF